MLEKFIQPNIKITKHLIKPYKNVYLKIIFGYRKLNNTQKTKKTNTEKNTSENVWFDIEASQFIALAGGTSFSRYFKILSINSTINSFEDIGGGEPFYTRTFNPGFTLQVL